MLHLLQYLLILAFPALVAVAALRDLTSFTIPNWISLALICAFVPAAIAAGVPWTQVGLCAAVGVVGLVIGMGLFAAGWVGGGDAKLLAAASLWIGWPACVTYLVYTALAGGGLACLLLGLRSAWVRPALPKRPGWFARLIEPGAAVPYGVAIAIGALAAFPASPILRALGV